MEIGQKHKRFLAVVAATLLILTAGLFGTFYAMFNTQTIASVSKCSGASFKSAMGEAMGSPKMVIIAGSSAVNGLNAEMLSSAVGMPVLNMGLFASLGPRVMLEQAKSILHPGDVALIALEYNSYTFDAPTGPTIDYILGCGQSIFAALPLRDKVRYVFALDPTRIFDTVRHSGDNLALSDPADDAQPPESLTKFGDKRLDARFFPPISADERERMALYQPATVTIDRTADGVIAIAEFAAWAKAHDVRVLATWPNTIYFPSYETNPGFAEIEKFYADIGIPMVGTPAISWFPAKMFYDTQYHLDIEGIVLRTKMLMPVLKQTLDVTKAGG